MTNHTLGDGPIQPEYIEQMKAIAAALDETFNDGLRGADRPNGAKREDIVTLMKEMIARFEGQPEMKGTA